jgi:hypothetical protein
VEVRRSATREQTSFFFQKYYLFYDVRFHPEVVFEDWTAESGAAAYEWRREKKRHFRFESGLRTGLMLTLTDVPRAWMSPDSADFTPGALEARRT